MDAPRFSCGIVRLFFVRDQGVLPGFGWADRSAASHPFATLVLWHDEIRGAADRRGQSESATTPRLGVMTSTTRAGQGSADPVHAALGARGSSARTW